jgi:hypothetical protein
MRYSWHQQSQENVAWVFRLSLWIDPHSGHVRLVLRGSTATTWMPLSVALCVKNFTLAVVKQGASTLAANEPNLLAAGKRPDAHPVVGDEPEDAIVVRLSRVFAQFDDAFLVVGFLRCLGVGPPWRCNEMSAWPVRAKSQRVSKYIKFCRSYLRERRPRSRAARSRYRRAALKRIEEQLRLLLRGRRQLETHHQLHAFIEEFLPCFNAAPRCHA